MEDVTTGTEEITTEETPNVTTMDRESLEKAFSGEVAEETTEEQKPEETPKEEAPAEGKHKESKEEPLKETPKEGEQEPPDEMVSKAEYEKLQKRWENQEKLLQRFANEVGVLRKTSPEDVQKELQEIRELYFEDPIAAQEKLTQLRSRQAEEAKAEEKAKAIQRIQENQKAISQFVPEFEAQIDDIADIIKADGADEALVKNFKENPYLLDHTTLFNMSKRAQIAKENAMLRSELESAKKEIEALKKKPDELLRKIEEGSRFKSENASSRGAQNTTRLYDKLPQFMTRDELEAAKKQAVSGG